MRLWIMIGAALVAAALTAVVLHLHPPGSLRMAAGPSGGAYEQIAQDYAEILARDEIRVDILETAGSVENARLIESGGAEAALLQGGIAVDPDTV